MNVANDYFSQVKKKFKLNYHGPRYIHHIPHHSIHHIPIDFRFLPHSYQVPTIVVPLLRQPNVLPIPNHLLQFHFVLVPIPNYLDRRLPMYFHTLLPEFPPDLLPHRFHLHKLPRILSRLHGIDRSILIFFHSKG